MRENGERDVGASSTVTVGVTIWAQTVLGEKSRGAVLDSSPLQGGVDWSRLTLEEEGEPHFSTMDIESKRWWTLGRKRLRVMSKYLIKFANFIYNSVIPRDGDDLDWGHTFLGRKSWSWACTVFGVCKRWFIVWKIRIAACLTFNYIRVSVFYDESFSIYTFADKMRWFNWKWVD